MPPSAWSPPAWPSRSRGFATDQHETLKAIASSPVGRPVLVALIVPIGAYVLWGFVRAVYDPRRKGDDPMGLATRLGYAWSGLSYTALLIFTLELTIGLAGGGSEDDSTRRLAGAVLQNPIGVWLAALVGAIGIMAGLGQFLEAYHGGFLKDLQRSRMNKEERLLADTLGRYGMVARGVIFTILGWFVVQAALQRDPNQAHGMAYAFQALAVQPLGRVWLFVVGVGFIALAFHSSAAARWMKMPL